MADNYLEKKYEEFVRGRPVMRRNTPSLDTLLKKAADVAEADLSYVVKQAQLDALVRSASLLGGQFVFESFETSSNSAAFVKISSLDGLMCLGEAVLVVRLKAAELGLDSFVEVSEIADSSVSATVFIFRKRSL